MNILMTSDAVGGVGVYASRLAGSLAARGHRVTLAVFAGRGRGGAGGRGGAVEQVPAPFGLEWQSEREAGALAAERAAARAWLAALGRDRGARILHTNHFAYTGCLDGAPTLLVVHSDVVSWWRSVRGTPPPDSPFDRWYRDTVRVGLARAQAVATPSRAALDDLRLSFAWEGDGRVLPHGGHGRRPAPAAHRPPLAVSLGRLWDEGKQAALLWRDDLAMPVVVAGEAGERPPPQGARLRYVGRLAPRAVAALLCRARVYIATSAYEPFGLAPLEAAGAGCALLLNDLPSFREIWGDAATYFARNNGDAMARALRRFAHDPDWAAARAAAAQNHAARQYSLATMTTAYEALYRNLAASS